MCTKFYEDISYRSNVTELFSKKRFGNTVNQFTFGPWSRNNNNGDDEYDDHNDHKEEDNGNTDDDYEVGIYLQFLLLLWHYVVPLWA